MKTLIVVLIMAAFLQATILPLDLVLLILIVRAYIKAEKENLYLGFYFGLLISILDLSMLGLISMVYLVVVALTESISKSRLAAHPLLLIPVSFTFLALNQAVYLVSLHQSMQFQKLITESFLSLPVFYLIRFWEERFIVRKEIKLKI